MADKCNDCGLCVPLCKGFAYKLENYKVTLSATLIFDCPGCGYRKVICSTHAIVIIERLAPNHV